MTVDAMRASSLRSIKAMSGARLVIMAAWCLCLVLAVAVGSFNLFVGGLLWIVAVGTGGGLVHPPSLHFAVTVLALVGVVLAPIFPRWSGRLLLMAAGGNVSVLAWWWLLDVTVLLKGESLAIQTGGAAVYAVAGLITVAVARRRSRRS